MEPTSIVLGGRIMKYRSETAQDRRLKTMTAKISAVEEENKKLRDENRALRAGIEKYESAFAQVKETETMYHAAIDRAREIEQKYTDAIVKLQELRANYKRDINSLIEELRK